jgi:Thioredoxin-like
MLFKTFAEYHQSLSGDKYPAERLQAVREYAAAFEQICQYSQTGILAGLKESSQDQLQRMVDYAKRFVLATPAEAVPDLPPITPRFYHPDMRKGYYYDKFILISFDLARWDEGDRTKSDHTKASTKRDAANPYPASKEDSTRPKLAPELQPALDLQPVLKPQPALEPLPPPIDLVQTCQKARVCHCWVMVIIYSNNTSSRTLRKVMARNEFICDTIRGGFVLCTRQETEAGAFVAEHGVMQFPYVAIIEPLSMSIRWSTSFQCDSESMMTERLADELLHYGSFDPYEGLIATNVPQGCEPPTHLVFTAGGFRAALREAEATDRWMLVNLQSDDALACHRLNRDVWRDDAVESIVKENFVFWQKVRSKNRWVKRFTASNDVFLRVKSSTCRTRGRCMPRYSKSSSFRIFPFSTHSADWSCGAKRVGRLKSLSLQRHWSKLSCPFPTLMIGN